MGKKTAKISAVKSTKATKKAAAFSSTPKLTEQQKKFCKYVASGMNTTQAALKAKYAKASARQQGSRLMTKDDISAYVELEAQKAQEKFEYTKETHFLELEEAEDFAKKTGNVSAFLNAIVQKGKLCGLYIEKQEMTIKEPRRFVVEIVKPKK